MPERASTVLGLVFVAAASSCSLFVSLDGLNGSPNEAGVGDASSSDASDAAAPILDAGVDATTLHSFSSTTSIAPTTPASATA